MIAHVSATMVFALEKTAVCTDARNAGGSGLRSTMWKAALDACPKLAGVLQNLFGKGLHGDITQLVELSSVF